MRVVYKFQHFCIYVNIRNTSLIIPSKTILRAKSETSDIFSTKFLHSLKTMILHGHDNIITSLTTSLNSTWRDKRLMQNTSSLSSILNYFIWFFTSAFAINNLYEASARSAHNVKIQHCSLSNKYRD